MGKMLEEHNIGFMDCGTSGGVWGLENGYCLMVGATEQVAKAVEPALRALAVTPQNGWLHVGPVGSGHFSKMIHNGIEYGMMESLAEGLELLKGKEEFGIDIAKVTELWRHGSVVRSWLLDLTAEALQGDQNMDKIRLLTNEIYDFSKDQKVLQQPNEFEKYRRNYPIRYEWHHFSSKIKLPIA